MGNQIVAAGSKLAEQKERLDAARSDVHWKIFNDIDMKDEAEMLELAHFLQTLLDHAPIPGKVAEGDAAAEVEAYIGGEESDDEGVEQDASGYAEATGAGAAALDLNSITIAGVGGAVGGGMSDEFDSIEYTLPRGPISYDTACRVLEVYRKGGRLSAKGVKKVLREHYKMLKEMPNICEMEVPSGGALIVVGDLHGQITDLLHILEQGGLPSEKNRYIFNGDFVDRGEMGLEICSILMAFQCALGPENVMLNRGNHEEYTICQVYGFQNEVKRKYDDLTFSMFVEVFRYLPISTIVEGQVIVLHGGLFHRDGVTLEDLKRLPRIDYVPKPSEVPIDYTQLEDPEERELWFLSELNRDALWSDPVRDDIREPNPRGAGVVFGPSVTREFLTNNDLRMVVRSHECVREGFDLPFDDDDMGILATVFSASNYGNSANNGAFMRFTKGKRPANSLLAGSAEVASSPTNPLWYTVTSYSTQEEAGIEGLMAANETNLREMVLRKKGELMSAFQEASADGEGVTLAQWEEIMTSVTGLMISWATLKTHLVPEPALKDDGNTIIYETFLDCFHSLLTQAVATQEGSSAMMDALYANRQRLEAIFRWFDVDGNGQISREEFNQGCELINERLPDSMKLTGIDHIRTLIDFDDSDGIDLNEFFEAFRMVDAADGQVDGVIGIAGGQR
uniref:Serine/threonine-protein phosphatase n=2 Tax=Phaeomonas parva TaxID=124430 RepID=A0A7S1U285_9STRA|mmetsp:Transcript_27617/g.87535  ORF Transcript_27617/g.87535 Transcript_27617/m.87535 type:complete len:679 (+) Transcript_27617:248-2284(+)|eukprot:CAMPEP_0118850954 /NCGR_PEP_ID=MMETSP1163-20130328/574_1 /TAXON_ID=124430 /ORGANISM="Phaeomonas parva, Strain CCMP2877" /LENGTH=678 /DNA_ID=CAMNT_0006783199 /DNA_START=198 /DNA_END=2234 /DNA_ORIENTATION=+